MKRTSLIVAATGAAAVLAVTGTALGVATTGRDAARPALAAATLAPTPDGQPSATGPAPGSPAGTAPAPTGTTPTTGDQVSPQRAGEIALARAGGGQITEIEAEREHDRDVWSVEILNGTTEHEIEVDRHDGSVVQAEQEPADDDDDNDDDDDDRDDD
ncbi:PepSY domain-containing protein [Micromonospora echinofusca]|uniref:PepSY domain-containing protein n=1 Tax=Micromonospora echinofusca TaxID=47858 RepID=A0ABS3VVU1_MICEH|nr:PepSY domain-containing protein [Micromonospora echinofusca]MBO4208662.1 hypothetical protein [Micromonospora echinofusca]